MKWKGQRQSSNVEEYKGRAKAVYEGAQKQKLRDIRAKKVLGYIGAGAKPTDEQIALNKKLKAGMPGQIPVPTPKPKKPSKTSRVKKKK